MKRCILCDTVSVVHQIETHVLVCGNKKTTYQTRYETCLTCGCDTTDAKNMSLNAKSMRKAKSRIGLDNKPLNGRKNRI